MSVPCEVVRDLLPLYHDDVCSENSRQVVDEHLAECDSCKALLARIDDNTLDQQLMAETEDVVGHHTKAIKRRSLVVGMAIASVLAIPVLITLIVNLATGHALDWFFIVLTSLMTLASVTVVPLVVEKYRGLWALGSFTVSLLLLLMTSCIYTGGSWFFVATIPVLLGLSVMFTPYVLSQHPRPGFITRHKGLLAMLANTLLLYGVILVSGLYIGGGYLDFWRPALLITSLSALLPWAFFLVIRYLKVNGLVKAGICTILGGMFFSAYSGLVNCIVAGSFGDYLIVNANLFIWNLNILSANISLSILVFGVAVGVIFLLIGLFAKKKEE
ncbi:MAG: zf-HC2 domain-containing protein [Coriobacteriales bacterium]|jgi:hypothetical protein|nr:zf-HC2 domain-containing protein [Coriobacteriales bacterium]